MLGFRSELPFHSLAKKIEEGPLEARRDLVPTDQILKPKALVSLLSKRLPASGMIRTPAGEWRQRIDGTWRFWLDRLSAEDLPRSIPRFGPMPAAFAAELVGASQAGPFKPRLAYRDQ
jgi:hypothetical protein